MGWRRVILQGWLNSFSAQTASLKLQMRLFLQMECEAAKGSLDPLQFMASGGGRGALWMPPSPPMAVGVEGVVPPPGTPN